MSAKMRVAVIGCGLMGSGIASLVSLRAVRMMIDSEEEKARSVAKNYGGSFSTELEAAKDADVIAVVIPASAVESVFRKLSVIAKSGSLVLDMATKGIIPQEVREERPDVTFLETKIVGSALGVRHGLPALLVADTDEPETLETLRKVFPGFESIVAGDPQMVRTINEKGTYYGIRAAVLTEMALREMNLPEEWRKAACGGLVPGIAIGYSTGQMGKFGREIAERIEDEIKEQMPELITNSN